MKGCIVKTCERKHRARDLCHNHYVRWFVNTHPEAKDRYSKAREIWYRKNKKKVQTYQKKYSQSEKGKQALLRSKIKNQDSYRINNPLKGRMQDPSREVKSNYWRQMRMLIQQYPKKTKGSNK